jgi:hypothetical protein
VIIFPTTATAVYVVRPTQVRDVVQQLTGGASSGIAGARDQGAIMATTCRTCTTASNNAMVRQHLEAGYSKGEEKGSSRPRALGQMHQECMSCWWIRLLTHNVIMHSKAEGGTYMSQPCYCISYIDRISYFVIKSNSVSNTFDLYSSCGFLHITLFLVIVTPNFFSAK